MHMAQCAIERVLVFTATLNEKDNIELLCDTVLGLSPNYDFLIVDDNSPDGTGRVLRQLAHSNKRIKVVHRPTRLGLGTAHKLAMLYAMDNDYDALVTMDADWSHDPNDIPRLVKELDEVDFVIGSRYMKGGKCDYHGYRRFLSIGANFLARVVLRVPLHEFTTSFRAFRVDLLKRISLVDTRVRGYSFFLEVATRVFRQGARIKEVPIHFSDRKAGTSKIPKYEVYKGIYRLGLLAFDSFSPKKLSIKSARHGMSCYLCSSPFLVETYPEKEYAGADPEALRCTSTSHKSNPQVLSCLQCGLDFVPDRKNLDKLYSGVVDETYVQFKEARYKTFNKTFELISPYLKEGSKLLEVGCYCGYFLDVARKNGLVVEGLDPSSWAVGRAKNDLDLNVYHGSVSDVGNLTKEEFDSIAMWDVLEHLEDPLKALQLLNLKLKENGHLFLSTLDIDNWFPKLTGSKWPWLMPMHVFYFRTPSLKYLLKKAGFEVVHISTYYHYISLRYFVKKAIALTPKFIHPPLAILEHLLPKAGPFIPFRFGDIKLYVCRKTAPSTAQEALGVPIPVFGASPSLNPSL